MSVLSEHEWAVAQRVCTAGQLEALDLWRRGWGWRRIALQLDIDVSSARARVERGRRRLRRALLDEREAA